MTWSSSLQRWVITILSHIYSQKCYSTCPFISQAAPRLATYLLWAYWLHKRSFFIIPATEGLNGRKPSHCWGYLLLSIIPATKGLSSRKPSYRWEYSLYPSSQLQRDLAVENPLTAGDIHYYPSSQPQRASAAENPLTAGDIHSYLSFQPQKASVAKTSLTVKGLHYYLSFQVTDGLSNKNSSYRWAYSSLHQERASSLEMCTIISSKRGFNQQLPFLPLDMFIFLAARGLSNRLPSLALFITTQQFNIRGLYQQTLIQLGRSIII